jgi:hypothetical protein
MPLKQPTYRPHPHKGPSRLRGNGAKKTGSHDQVELSDANQTMIVDLLKNLDEPEVAQEAEEAEGEYEEGDGEEYYGEEEYEYDENEEDYDQNILKLRKMGFRENRVRFIFSPL